MWLRKGAALMQFNLSTGYDLSFIIINHHPSQMLLKIDMTLEILQNTQKMLPLYSSQVTGRWFLCSILKS